jgi:hypothetical protein
MRFTGNAGRCIPVHACRLEGRGDRHGSRHGGNGEAIVGAGTWQFYFYQGSIPQIIDCPEGRDVKDNIASSQEEKIACGVNTEFNEDWWFYPDARDGTNECSR